MIGSQYKIAQCHKCHRTYTMDRFRPMSEHKAPFPCLNEGCEGSVFVAGHIYQMEPSHHSRTYYKRSLWYRFKSWLKKLFGIHEPSGTAPTFSKQNCEYKFIKNGTVSVNSDFENK